MYLINSHMILSQSHMYIMQCNAMPCRTPCHVMSCHVMSCHVRSRTCITMYISLSKSLHLGCIAHFALYLFVVCWCPGRTSECSRLCHHLSGALKGLRGTIWATQLHAPTIWDGLYHSFMIIPGMSYEAHYLIYQIIASTKENGKRQSCREFLDQNSRLRAVRLHSREGAADSVHCRMLPWTVLHRLSF